MLLTVNIQLIVDNVSYYCLQNKTFSMGKKVIGLLK